jgi:hypothetical protein
MAATIASITAAAVWNAGDACGSFGIGLLCRLLFGVAYMR